MQVSTIQLYPKLQNLLRPLIFSIIQGHPGFECSNKQKLPQDHHTKSIFHSAFSSTINSMTYHPSVYWSNKHETHVVIDSGVSRSIAPDSSDFVGPITPMDAPIQGLSSIGKIKGVVTVRWHSKHSLGTATTVETTAYYIPKADIELFSPQVYFSENKEGSFLMNSNCTILALPNDRNL